MSSDPMPLLCMRWEINNDGDRRHLEQYLLLDGLTVQAQAMLMRPLCGYFIHSVLLAQDSHHLHKRLAWLFEVRHICGHMIIEQTHGH